MTSIKPLRDNIHVQSFSGPRFPAFRLNTERYSISLHNQSKKNSKYGHFSRCKCYWSLLKTLLNGKKIPCIPHNNKYVSDFKEKSESFNSFFEEHCFLIPNLIGVNHHLN